jgi:hypothetical protein
MTRILMAGTGSGGERNFEQTVRNRVDLERYADALTASQYGELRKKHGRFARVWGFEAKRGTAAKAADELKRGDLAWFHNAGYVHTMAEVVMVFDSMAFDRALWANSDYPGSGFIFTMTEPREVQISKAAINELLGYKPRNTWQQNRLLDEKASKLLVSHLNDLTGSSGGGSARHTEGKLGQLCPTCHQVMPLTGVCDNCN